MMKRLLSYVCVISMLLSCLCLSSVSASAENTTYTKIIDFDTVGADYEPASSNKNNIVSGSGVIDYSTVDSTYTDGNVMKIIGKQYQDYAIQLGNVINGKKIKSISYTVWSDSKETFDYQNTGVSDNLNSTKLNSKVSFGFKGNIGVTTTKQTVTYDFSNVKFEDYSTISNVILRFKIYNGKIPVYFDNIVITYECFSGNFTGAAEGDRLIYANEDGVLTTPDATLADGEFAGWVTEDDADTIIPANTQLTLKKDEIYFAVTANRADQTAPNAPVLESKTSTSVTLAANSNYQYSMDGETWQDSNVFNGLTAGTEYTFYQRCKATPALKASPASKGLKVETASIFTFEAEKAVSTASGTYSGTVTSGPNSDTSTGSLVYVVHDSSKPAVGHYVTFNFTGLKPGYYQISLFSRNVANSRSTYNVTAYDETNAEQDAGSINFADLSTKYGNNTYYCNPSLANNVVVNSGSTLKLKFTISKVGTGSGSYIDKFVLTKVGDIVTEDPLAVDVSMNAGASIRMNQVNGIRFYTTVDQEKIAQLKADGAEVEMGTLIAPKDLLGDTELTLDLAELATPKAVNVKYQAKNEDGSYKYYTEGSNFSGIVGTIANVKEANITRDFVGRGYVKVTKGENTTISYADINVESSARSLKTVAAAIQGTDFYNNQLNDYQRSLVDTWAAK